MKSTLAELGTLVSRWEALRKQRPNENDLTPWGYSGIKAEDIDGMFGTWKEGLEITVTRTRAAEQPEERVIDATVSKLMRETRPHIDNAQSNGMGWLIQSTPFMANLALMAAHLSVVLAKRSDLRKGLLKIAASNLNDNILSVEKVATLAQQIIRHHEKIAEQKATVDAAVKEAEETGEELANVRGKVLADQTAVATLLTTANKNQADLKQHTETLESLIESSQTTLDEITKQKTAADKQIATGTELLANANAQLTKALQDINRQGLAGAFAGQAAVVAGERKKWVGAFGISIAWLIYVAYRIVDFTPGNGTPPFDPMTFLRGLPLAAPAIWLGWLSARQIGILARIQQDYAYKASTAVAFEGYKKEVASANDQALSKQLLETAVTNFGENPVRLYDKKSDDHGHPIETLVEKIQDPETRNFVVEVFKALKPEAKK
jgi:hypothetical protein